MLLWFTMHLSHDDHNDNRHVFQLTEAILHPSEPGSVKRKGSGLSQPTSLVTASSLCSESSSQCFYSGCFPSLALTSRQAPPLPVPVSLHDCRRNERCISQSDVSWQSMLTGRLAAGVLDSRRWDGRGTCVLAPQFSFIASCTDILQF